MRNDFITNATFERISRMHGEIAAIYVIRSIRVKDLHHAFVEAIFRPNHTAESYKKQSWFGINLFMKEV